MKILKITKKISEQPGYIVETVNATILGSGLYLGENIGDSPSKRAKYYIHGHNSHLILNTIESEALKLILNGITGLKIRIRILEEKNSDKVLADALCAFCKASRAYTISWNKEHKIALQSLFPVSTALNIAHGGKLKLDTSSNLHESIGIRPFIEENGNDGWDIFPEKIVDENKMPESDKHMIGVLKDYARNCYFDTSKNISKEKKHPNAFKESLPWMNADEFGRYNASKKNCIYTLASEPDIDGKRKIYVGEAQYLQNRLKIFKVNNETYIDHTKKEAEEHRFTRFRVDVLKDDAYAFLHSAQDSIIGALWMLKEECPNGYIMTNKALSMPISQAYSKDKINKNSEEDK